MKKCKKQVPRAPGIFSIDFSKELAQGLPRACSIDLKEDSIMELEGLLQELPGAFLIDFFIRKETI